MTRRRFENALRKAEERRPAHDGLIRRVRCERKVLTWIRTGHDDRVIGPDLLDRLEVARLGAYLLHQPAHAHLLGLEVDELTTNTVQVALEALAARTTPVPDFLYGTQAHDPFTNAASPGRGWQRRLRLESERLWRETLERLRDRPGPRPPSAALI